MECLRCDDREETSLKHILVGISYHSHDVMPFSGMFTYAGGNYIDITALVKVERIVEEVPTDTAEAANVA